MTTGAL